MRYILRTCQGREEYAEYLQSRITDLEICFDDVGGAMQNFVKSLEMSGDDAVVNLEDDIVLTKNFTAKVSDVVAGKADTIIQFFSMRKADKEVGSRWDAGRNYLMAQCTYFPPKISKGILAFSKKYDRFDHQSHPLDSMVGAYLAAVKRKYWIHCPSLVDHRIGKSRIDPRRASTNRQSFTFEDADL